MTWLWLWAACAPSETATDTASEREPLVCLQTSDWRVALGEVDVGQSTTASLTVSNACAEQPAEVLSLLEVTLDPEVDGLSVEVDQTSLADGEAATITVRFSPQGPVDVDSDLLIDSNDSDEPLIAVPVIGTGLASQLAATWTELEGVAGCEATGQVRLRNEGNSELTLSLDAVDEDWVIEAQSLALEPGGVHYLDVAWTPRATGNDLLELTLVTNDPAEPGLTLTGTATGETHTEMTEYQGAALDLLLVPDWSSGMHYGRLLIDTLEDLVDELDDRSIDYQISAALTQNGCAVDSPPWVDPSTTEAAGHLATLTGSPDGLTHEDSEAGFTIASAFTAMSAAGECNEGFVRGGELAMVFMSDDPEQSAESYDVFLAEFQALVHEPSLFSAHAIAGDIPLGCGSASPGYGFYEMVEATDGQYRSICDDFGPHIADILASLSPTEGVVTITGDPAVNTLSVAVDGAETDAWTHDETLGAIVLDPVPALGAEVTVRYFSTDACD